MNKYWIFTTKAKLIYFSGDQQSIISFLEIENLIKNLRSLTCEYVPQNTGHSLVFTVLLVIFFVETFV